MAGLAACAVGVVGLATGLWYWNHDARARSGVAAPLTPAQARADDGGRPPTRIVEVWSHQEPAPQPANEWVYPIVGVREFFPLRPGASFGVVRGGNARADCNGGHCGVDLYATRGTPVVAVADGVVQHVRRQRGISAGLYVHLAHPDGQETLYMHLDEIREDLARNVRVVRGEWLGSLGRSGISASPAHLHFALKHRGRHRDPEPKLADARVIGLMDMTVGLPDDWSPRAAAAPPHPGRP